MDAELGRVAEVIGADLTWSPAEQELLDTVEREVNRRAGLEAALADCEDPGSNRALKIATEVRLIEAQVARLVKALRRDMQKLLATKPSEEPTNAQPSIVSIKASRAANARWNRERLRHLSAQEQYRAPEAGNA